MKLISLDPFGTLFTIVGPIMGLVSLGVTVQSKRNEVQRENETSERAIRQNLKKIRNSMREAGESFQEITDIIQSVSVKYNNNFFREKYRSGVHLILDAQEAKAYNYSKKEMDQALCQAMILINGSVDLVINYNPKSTSVFIGLVGVLEKQINDIFLMDKPYSEVIDETLSLIETVNQRLSEMTSNRF